MEKEYKMTHSHYAELEKELDYLKYNCRFEVAKEEQYEVEARIEEVEEILRQAVIVDEFTVDGNVLLRYNGLGENAVIPEGIREIGSEALVWKRRLTSVAIPESVTEIGANAFCGCESLVSGSTLEGFAENK